MIAIVHRNVKKYTRIKLRAEMVVVGVEHTRLRVNLKPKRIDLLQLRVCPRLIKRETKHH